MTTTSIVNGVYSIKAVIYHKLARKNNSRKDSKAMAHDPRSAPER